MWRTWTKKRYVCTSCLYKSLTFQGCRKLFSGFFMSNNVGHHGWPTEKKKKLAKTPKSNPPKMKRSIYTFQWTSSEFFLYFRFSSGKSHCQQKLSLRVTYFTIKFCSKHLTHFMNVNWLDIDNNMLPKHSQRPFLLYRFFIKRAFVWC